jgi:hypothetical protein
MLVNPPQRYRLNTVPGPSTLDVSRRVLLEVGSKAGTTGEHEGVTFVFPPGETDVRTIMAGNDILEFSKTCRWPCAWCAPPWIAADFRSNKSTNTAAACWPSSSGWGWEPPAIDTRNLAETSTDRTPGTSIPPPPGSTSTARACCRCSLDTL